MTSTKSAGNKATEQTPAAPGHLCLCFSPDKAAEHRVTSLADFLQHKEAADAAGSGITWLYCEQPDAALVATMRTSIVTEGLTRQALVKVCIAEKFKDAV